MLVSVLIYVSTAACNTEADIVFLLDSSGSVGRADFQRLLSFVESVVGELNVDANRTRIGLLTFSTDVRIAFYLDSFETADRISKAITGVAYQYGDSNMADAFR